MEAVLAGGQAGDGGLNGGGAILRLLHKGNGALDGGITTNNSDSLDHFQFVCGKEVGKSKEKKRKEMRARAGVLFSFCSTIKIHMWNFGCILRECRARACERDRPVPRPGRVWVRAHKIKTYTQADIIVNGLVSSIDQSNASVSDHLLSARTRNLLLFCFMLSMLLLKITPVLNGYACKYMTVWAHLCQRSHLSLTLFCVSCLFLT